MKAICPKCKKRGGVVAKSDAWVVRDVLADGTRSKDENVQEFDHTEFECVLCESELDVSDIASSNQADRSTVKYGH
jgi:hypothetical protein